jgi:hypothetical protein
MRVRVRRFSELRIAIEQRETKRIEVNDGKRVRQGRTVRSLIESCLRPACRSLTVWAFIAFATNTPAADFCCTVRVNLPTLSHDSVTCSRPPEVSSIAFHAQPPDLPPVSLMDVGFAITCSLARHRRPQIQFLSIGSRVCSALPSDFVLRLGPCASLTFHLHQVG